jgi:hypothetical protein
MATLAPSTTDELRDLLAHVIAGAAGGTEAAWRKRIAIERVPTWRHVRYNWLAEATGTVEQRAVIAKAVEIVRSERPYAVR